MQWRDVSRNWSAYLPRITTRWPGIDEAAAQSADGDQDRFIDVLTDHFKGDRVMAQMEMADWLVGEEPVDAVMDSTRDNARISASAASIPAGEEPLDDDSAFGDDAAPEPPIARAS